MAKPILTSHLVPAHGYLYDAGHRGGGTDQVLKENNLGMYNGFRIQTSSPTASARGAF